MKRFQSIHASVDCCYISEPAQLKFSPEYWSSRQRKYLIKKNLFSPWYHRQNVHQCYQYRFNYHFILYFFHSFSQFRLWNRLIINFRYVPTFITVILFHISTKFYFYIGLEMVMCHALICVKEIHQSLTW